jgi:hypothetical protein
MTDDMVAGPGYFANLLRVMKLAEDQPYETRVVLPEKLYDFLKKRGDDMHNYIRRSADARTEKTMRRTPYYAKREKPRPVFLDFETRCAIDLGVLSPDVMALTVRYADGTVEHFDYE